MEKKRMKPTTLLCGEFAKTSGFVLFVNPKTRSKENNTLIA